MKYFYNTANFKITYEGDHWSNLHTTYVDADFAMDLNDQKSRFSFLLMLNDGPIAWGSKKQPTTTSNTIEVEYHATQKGAPKIFWMRQLLNDLRYPQTKPTMMYNDNQATIWLIQNPKFHQRTKHINIKYHIIQESYQRMDLTIFFITRNNNLADTFTKPFAHNQFQQFHSLMGTSSL